MNNKENFHFKVSYPSCSPNFLGMLTVLFIGLKLGGIIDWSWVWVLSPLWIPFMIIVPGLAIWGIVIIVALIVAMINERYF